jgi:hypothetical protein
MMPKIFQTRFILYPLQPAESYRNHLVQISSGLVMKLSIQGWG